jgi:hypothetical protein
MNHCRSGGGICIQANKVQQSNYFGSLWNNRFSYIWNLIIQGLKVVVRRCYSTYGIMPRVMRDPKYPPSSTARRPFWAWQGSPAKHRVVLLQGLTFHCGCYWNTKEKAHLSIPESVPLGSNVIYTSKIRISNPVSCSQEQNVLKLLIKRFVSSFAK